MSKLSRDKIQELIMDVDRKRRLRLCEAKKRNLTSLLSAAAIEAASTSRIAPPVWRAKGRIA